MPPVSDRYHGELTDAQIARISDMTEKMISIYGKSVITAMGDILLALEQFQPVKNDESKQGEADDL